MNKSSLQETALDAGAGPDSPWPEDTAADIAFLLIVFFMVTSVFSVTRGLEFQLPTRDTETPQDATAEDHPGETTAHLSRACPPLH